MKTRVQKFVQKVSAFAVLLSLCIHHAMAQSAAGIDQATSEVSSYIDPVCNLIIAIGAVVGLIGGVRV